MGLRLCLDLKLAFRPKMIGLSKMVMGNPSAKKSARIQAGFLGWPQDPWPFYYFCLKPYGFSVAPSSIWLCRTNLMTNNEKLESRAASMARTPSSQSRHRSPNQMNGPLMLLSMQTSKHRWSAVRDAEHELQNYVYTYVCIYIYICVYFSNDKYNILYIISKNMYL